MCRDFSFDAYLSVFPNFRYFSYPMMRLTARIMMKVKATVILKTIHLPSGTGKGENNNDNGNNA